MATQFTFGAGNERIGVRILGWARSTVPIKNHIERLDSAIHLVIGAFSGSFTAEFSTNELMILRQQLSNSLSSGSGKASFKSIGGDLSLEIELFDAGHAVATGTARPHGLQQSTLDFKFDIPQMSLARTAQEVEDTFRELPNPATL